MAITELSIRCAVAILLLSVIIVNVSGRRVIKRQAEQVRRWSPGSVTPRSLMNHRPISFIQMAAPSARVVKRQAHHHQHVNNAPGFQSMRNRFNYSAISAKATALRTKRARTIPKIQQERIPFGDYAAPSARPSNRVSMMMPSNNNHDNFYRQSFQRTVMPVVYRSPVQNYYMQQPTYMRVLPAASSNQERIVIPVGTSYYQPIQYVDTFSGPPPLDISYLRRMNFGPSPAVNISSASNFFSRYGSPNNQEQPKPVAIDSKGSESTTHQVTAAATATSSKPNATNAAPSASERVFLPSAPNILPMRTIELESRTYAPLTIRFPPIPTELNIIPSTMESDLVGQDSQQHDSSFGRRTSPPATGTGLSNDKNSNNNNEVNTGPQDRYFGNLNTRMIFGNDVVEEPLILKQGAKSQPIPLRMQRIIKCVFPDFKFDGDDKVESAC